MAQSEQHAPIGITPAVEPAAYLQMPDERRAAAKAQAAALAATARTIALELPLDANADDFRRLLISEAKT
jgi:hypothetical protein